MAELVTLLVIAAVIGLVVGGVALAKWLHRKRMARLAAVAQALGLQFAEKDPLNCLGISFELFREGKGRGVDWTMWGETPARRHVRAVEYWYYDQSYDAQGSRRRTYHRFTCVLTEVGGNWPHMTIAHEGFFRALRDALGFRDIQFESEEFNRRFNVHCDDGRFASTFVDPRMMQFLLDTAAKTRFEVLGGWTLCATRRVDPEEVRDLVAYNDRFQTQIPAVVSDLYP